MEATRETRRVRATLPGGASVWVEATDLSGGTLDDSEREVSALDDLKKSFQLDQLGPVISGLAQLVHAGVIDTKPSKSTVEFSLEVGIESGQLTALLVKGTGNAGIKVTLEW
jgi:Trypsin-co-occurring domain 1